MYLKLKKPILNFYISISDVQEKHQLVVNKAKKFGHNILFSEYGEQLADLSNDEMKANKPQKRFQTSKIALLKLCCEKHPDAGIQETTVSNYLRSRCGLSCCGRVQVSEKLTNRVFSDDTLKKMSDARKRIVQKNPSRTEKQIENQQLIHWRKSVFERGNYLCAISGVKSETFNAHHLYSKKVFPSIKFDPDNGVLLDAKIHQHFHNTVGSLYIVTLDHFLEFLEKLRDSENFRMETFRKVKPRKNYPSYEQLISNNLSFFNEPSSFKETKDKCSETIAYYNIENICELLERMTELKKHLFSKLTDEGKELAIAAFRYPIDARAYSTNTRSDEESSSSPSFNEKR